MPKTIAMAGSLAQKPGHGGHAWVFLQYLLGFKQLGWDVLFLDELPSAVCVDEMGERCSLDKSVNLRSFKEVMSRFGLAASHALLDERGECVSGLDRKAVLQGVRESAFLLNVMGYLADADIRAAAPRRVFLDIDPGFGQMWRSLNLCDVFAGHDAFVTIGENIGRKDCVIPTCGLEWITTRQPVVLDHWPMTARDSGGPDFSSVGAWRGPFAPIEYQGATYGLRVHEFRKFMELPRRTGRSFHLALDIHPGETKDLQLLAESGWTLVDPTLAAITPGAYQSFIQSSGAEFMPAKNMYVGTRSGWISDRTICYLACGKPVLAQNTGIKDRYPTGEGLLAFSTLAEAEAGVARITRDYDRHARAARTIAEEYFDSDKVLSQLLLKLGVHAKD